jgi:hypothetical protein
MPATSALATLTALSKLSKFENVANADAANLTARDIFPQTSI